ncbi:MAG: hypothetical protein II824_05440 [Bacteroidales bacterium]|nr:hypothetical protein [Bacteroidales bacterium]
MNLLHPFLEGLGKGRESAHITLDDDSLLEGVAGDRTRPRRLWGVLPYQVPMQKGLRLLMILAALVVAVTFVLHYSLVFFKDDLLSPGTIRSNDKGALQMSESFEREYGVFLFNTSDLWADTGIRIEKGDHIRLAASGAFHSSIGDLKRDAQENAASDTAQIHWRGSRDRSKGKTQQDAKKEYLLNAAFSMGDILFCIAPDSSSPMEEKSQALTPTLSETGMDAPESGNLYVAVNDLYFPTPQNLRDYGNESFGKERFGEAFPARALSERQGFEKIFYNDNLGQILLTVEIFHPLKRSVLGPVFLNPRQPYRWVESRVDRLYERQGKLSFFPCLAYFTVFVLWALCILATWMVLVLGGIYLLFLGIYWLVLAFPMLSQVFSWFFPALRDVLRGVAP